MPWYWYFSGFVAVALFYTGSSFFEKEWSAVPGRSFEGYVFGVSVVIRVLWVIGYYLFTTSVWHTPWEQPIGTSMDSNAYYYTAEWFYNLIKENDLATFVTYLQLGSASDNGYPLFLMLLRFLIRDNILLTRIPNVLFDSWTVVLVYRIAKANFDESTGRLASIFALFMPMMIFYTGVTMKESLMLMLATWAIERGDMLIRERAFSFINLSSFVILALSLVLFRTALAWVLVLAFACALILSSEKVVSFPRRFTIAVVLVLGGLVFFSGEITEQTEELLQQYDSTGKNFENRAKHGNTLVENLSKGTFAPIIFTLPFPTMVDIPEQYIQQLQNGGYYIKNILSFFCLFALFALLFRGGWRNNVMIIAYLIGYLIVLGLSSFVHSGRFHHPALPVELMLAAYGINQISNKKEANLFDYFLVIEFLVILFWNWYKLKGRGLL